MADKPKDKPDEHPVSTPKPEPSPQPQDGEPGGGVPEDPGKSPDHP